MHFKEYERNGNGQGKESRRTAGRPGREADKEEPTAQRGFSNIIRIDTAPTSTVSWLLPLSLARSLVRSFLLDRTHARAVHIGVTNI